MNKEEISKLLRAYEKRELLVERNLYSKVNNSHLYSTQSFERKFFSTINNSGLGKDLSKLKVLDVGCGHGTLLLELVAAGFNPKNCFGIDLIKERIKAAKAKNPLINFQVKNGQKIPFKNEYFDIVIQSGTFSSILKKRARYEVAKEMLRVLKAEGVIIWYDFFLKNPKNKDVVPIRKKEIEKLFAKEDIVIDKITLMPFLSRAINSFLPTVILEKLKLLCGHYFVTIYKKPNGLIFRPMRQLDFDDVVELHKKSFNKYTHTLLGPSFLKKFFLWFLNNQDSVAVISSDKGKIIAYAIGSKAGYKRKINYFLATSALSSIINKPWLMLWPPIWTGFFHRLFKSGPAQKETQNFQSPIFYLESLAVAKDQQKKGIGSKMLKYIIEQAKQLSYKTVTVHVHKKNISAIKMYNNFGFIFSEKDGNSLLYYRNLK